MNKPEKIKFVRGGVTRHFGQDKIDMYSTETEKWPESQGWVRVSDEVVDALRLKEDLDAVEKAKAEAEAAKLQAEKEAAEKEAADKAAGAGKKKSSDFKTTNEDLIEMKKYIENLAQSEIEEFFDGETRATILNHKP